MFNTLFGDLPFLQSFIKAKLNHYLGIDINSCCFSLDNDNNLSFTVKNIEANTSKINDLFLAASFIKIAKANIRKLEITVNFNEINITVDGVNALLMPMINKKKHIKESKHKQTQENLNDCTNQKQAEKELKSNNDSNNKSSERQNESFSANFTKLLISKINVFLTDINVYILNYESNSINLPYINPCLSIHLPEVKYEKMATKIKKRGIRS